MKVCHFIASRGLGRGEFYIDLANELCRHIEVSLLVPKGARYLHRVSPEIEIHEYRANNSRRNPLLLFELYRYLKKNPPDLVHTHFSKATEIFLPLNRGLQLPHVATKHNPRKGRVYERTPHVIAVSNIVRSSIQNGAPEVIHNGITPLPMAARNKRPATFTIVAVGRLDPIKGFDQLLRDLAPLDLDFRLKIIGDGSQREMLSRLIDELKLGDKVELCGFREDIPEQLANADLVLISSQSEGGPVIALETLFYGNMLLSTPVGIIPEILPADFQITPGGFGCAVESVANNYNKYHSRFQEIQTSYRDEFLLSNIAQQHIDYYKKIRNYSAR